MGIIHTIYVFILWTDIPHDADKDEDERIVYLSNDKILITKTLVSYQHYVDAFLKNETYTILRRTKQTKNISKFPLQLFTKNGSSNTPKFELVGTDKYGVVMYDKISAVAVERKNQYVLSKSSTLLHVKYLKEQG